MSTADGRWRVLIVTALAEVRQQLAADRQVEECGKRFHGAASERSRPGGAGFLKVNARPI